MDKDGDGFVTQEEARAYARARQNPERPPAGPEIPDKEEMAASPRPGEPPLKKMPDCDATRDAAGRGQLFESIVVPGFTSIQEGMNGLAIVDLNKDGRFEDIGGTDLVPDFGGFYRDSARDKAGPDINLRDLDNDGDLDLIQSYHVDIHPRDSNIKEVPTLARRPDVVGLPRP